MKKMIFAAVAALGMLFGSQFSAKAQVEEGNFIIDPYVGVPTINIWWKNLVDLDQANSGTVGPPIGFGGRLSYMVSDNFGIGIDFNYVKSGYQYTSICYSCGDWDTTSMSYEDVEQEYRFESNVMRIMIRMDYHFVQTENLDVYLGIGAGYKYANRQGYVDGVVDGSVGWSGAAIPVATRAAIGMRYYFIPNLGLNLELGLGGGQIIEGGISVKI